MTRFRHDISRDAITLERNEALARRVVQAGPEVEGTWPLRRLSSWRRDSLGHTRRISTTWDKKKCLTNPFCSRFYSRFSFPSARTSRVYASFGLSHTRVFFSFSASDSVRFPKGVTKARRRRRSLERVQFANDTRAFARYATSAARNPALKRAFALPAVLFFFFFILFSLKFILRASERELLPRDLLIAETRWESGAMSVPATRTILPDNIEDNYTCNMFVLRNDRRVTFARSPVHFVHVHTE